MEAEETLTDMFFSVVRRLRRANLASLAQWGVTPAQTRALRVLNRHGSMRMAVLSEHLNIAARSATEVADDLAAKHLVQRSPDPSDRRATLIALTQQGAALCTAIDTAQSIDAHRVFGRLTDAETENLGRMLKKLRD